jgi:hypothetical protein
MATPGEIQQIVARMSGAPFNTHVVRVPPRERGRSYQGITLGARADSGSYHLVKRVVIDHQLAGGTTFDQYLDCLHRAAAHPAARLVLYAAGGDHFAATLTPTSQVAPPEQLGARPLPLLLVVYSAERGIIKTGYMVSSLAATSIPKGALWLK